jgi:murein DD-endopeptidase MepM/ murein hydrolase activator NlpD
MAKIDTNKFIPQNRTENRGLSSQRVSVSSGVSSGSAPNINPSDVKPEGSENQPKKTLLLEVIDIRKNLLLILKLVKGNNSLLKKSEERQRKEQEQQKFQEKELKSEEKKNKLIPDFKPTEFPKMGFLDRIKQFLFYTVLGAAFTKFGKHIPQVLGLLKNLGPAFTTFENITGNILNGFVDFVGFGYKAYDKVKEIIVGISGDETEKRLQEFDKQFNTFANLAIIAGMAAAGSTDFSGGSGKKERLGVDKQTGQRVSKRAQARYLNQYGQDAYIKKFGKRSFTGLTGKAPSRFAGRLAGKALGKVPIIGGLVDFIISTVIFKENPGRAAAKAVGATIGSALGTFVPVPFAGTILGGILGDIVGGALYDSLVGGDKLKAKAQGGQATRGGKRVSAPIKRTIKRTRTKPTRIKPQRTIPGKDVGGRKQIEKLFPSPTNPRQKNPLGTLENASKNYKERVPLIGGIMGAAIDSTMGQRPDPTTFKRIGTGFGHLIQNAIDAETNGTIAGIQNQIVGLAAGGMVPRTLSTNENIGMKIGESIGKALEAMVNSQVNNTLQSIRQQFTKEDYMTPGGGVPDGGDVPGAEISGNQQQAANDLIEYFTKLYGRNAAIGIVANLLRESGLRTYAPEGGFNGMAQWDDNRWSKLVAWANSKGKDPMSRSTQAEYIAIELNQSGTGNRIKNAKTPEDAASIFYNEFERAAYSKPIKGNAYNPDNPHERKNRAFIATLTGKGAAGPEAMVTGGVKPSQIPLTSGQGWRWGKIHKGIDLDGGDNSPISSAQDAKVVFAGDKNDGYGNTVVLRYSNGAETRFAHLNRINVRTGQQLKAGQLIGTQGNTGASKGSHLHFEYYPRGGAMSYEGYGNAASVKDSYFRYGGNVKPKVLSKPADPANKPSAVSGAVTGYGKVGTAEYFYSNKKYWERKNGQTKEISARSYAAIRTNHSGSFGIAPGIDANKLKLPDGGYRPKSDYQASLAPSSSQKIASGLNQQASYELAGGFTLARQTMIIEKSIPTPVGGGIVNNIASTQAFNQTQATLANA